MFGGNLRRGRSPIGIDLGAHSIKMIQLERVGSGKEARWAVSAAAMRALPADLSSQTTERSAVLGALIQEMIAGGGFHGRKVVTCLPADAVQYKNLRLPPMPSDELQSAVEWEATDRLSFDRSQVQLQFLDAGEVRQGEETRQEVILMAVPVAVVEEHVAMLSRCGLQPLAIDATPAALARSVADALPSCDSVQAALLKDDPGARDVCVILDVGRATTKVLITRRGRVVFFKLIEMGSEALHRAVAERLQLSPEEAQQRWQVARDKMGSANGTDTSIPDAAGDRMLADAAAGAVSELSREVQLCLRYYSVTFRGKRPDQAAVVGGAGGDALLVRLLAEQSGIHMSAVSPLETLDVAKSARLPDDIPLGQWAVALGLALRNPGSAQVPQRMEAAA